jgi:uncharacterized membrane protein
MDPYQPPDDRDIDNPYAPPQSAFAPEPLPALEPGMPFTVADVFNWTWAIFKEKMWLCIGIFFGTQGINLGISFALGFLAQGVAAMTRDATLFTITRGVVQIASGIVGVWLGIGQARAYLKIARGEPVEFSEIFRGGRYVMTTFFATIIFVMILFAPIMLAVGVISFGMAAAGPSSVVGVVLFLVGASLAAVFVVYVTARLALYYYLIIDRNAGPIDSLRQTWELCRDRAGMILLVLFLNIAICIAGLLALCVGLVFALPLANLLIPVTYVAMTGTRPRRPEKPEFLFEEDL